MRIMKKTLVALLTLSLLSSPLMAAPKGGHDEDDAKAQQEEQKKGKDKKEADRAPAGRPNPRAIEARDKDASKGKADAAKDRDERDKRARVADKTPDKTP